MKKKILIVEDEAKMQRVLQLHLEGAGYEVIQSSTAEDAIAIIDKAEGPSQFALALTDLRLPGMDGLALLKRMSFVAPTLPVVVMTAFGTIETAVEAMKAGASDYVLKPF